jgi:hypothetical protein
LAAEQAICAHNLLILRPVVVKPWRTGAALLWRHVYTLLNGAGFNFSSLI